MDVFKYEQMYMVEVHQNLRKSFSLQELKLHRAQRTIAYQERILKENRAIMYDCLNGIFKVVSTKKDHIVQSLQDSVQNKMLGRKVPRMFKDIDPFELY